ncbi:MAG: DUF1292 domain-containing protein [Lachnospiraceae bacterium]|nr:DUF1292 domain-containing protein [Lachnospiraceae bacterium]
MERLTFTLDSDETVEFAILEETRINGVNYLLVTDAFEDEEEGEAYILKDTSDETDLEAKYEFVEDDTELEAISKVFAELLEDVDIEL